MFLDEKPQGEIATKLKLSEAIRKGLPLISENSRNWRFCALGAAFAGVRGHQMTNDEAFEFILQRESPPERIADALGFSRELCNTVSNKHYNGWSATAIADWLEAHGF